MAPGPVADAVKKTVPAELFSSITLGVSPNDFTAVKQSSEKIVVLAFDPGVNAVLADLLPTDRVSWVHSMYTGVDWIDKSLSPLFEKHQVPLSNARGASSGPLAEHVILSILYFNRNVARMHALRRAKEWNRYSVSAAAKQRLVIIGYGDIAREVARKAINGLDMSVVGIDVAVKEEKVDALGARVVPTSAMPKELAEADFVCLVLPKLPTTHHLLSRELIALLKPSCVVVNIGRGSTIDEAALCDAIKNDRIKGAALDVFEVEPLPAASPLWTFDDDRVLLTSHNAYMTTDVWDQLATHFVGHAEKFVSEGTLPEYTTTLGRGF
jgi:phosphoglycerate dehydrogenase-like enzyme